MKKKCIIICIVIVAVLLGGGLFFYKADICRIEDGGIHVGRWPGQDCAYYVYDDYAVAAYCDNQGIEKITIPDTFWGKPITQIRVYFCRHLVDPTEVVIGSNVEMIGEMAFSESFNLTNVYGGENVKVIDEAAFFHCKELESVEFGENLEQIGDSAFAGCDALTKLNTSEKLSSVAREAFFSSGIEEIYLPEGVNIGECAFDATPLENSVQ